ncbi:hypothetical protein FHW96_004100 [Novosphingobium sp. SG751A]|uniref:hypothetical protein n=1 Tax=Novosphingobium sp. SG751A TaxID=2587000 RepID=UPI001554F3F6|nr:hypothetical protein [Novosphingobium sp. SG751A]NOW47916.1 hypothetical protein [Novosphingobium sp. SG751A]
MAKDRPAPAPAFKRKIFYLPGYDPRGSRHYHAILAEEAAKDGALNLSRRRRAGANVVWTLERGDGAASGAHEFLVWDDIVRATWAKHPPALLRQGIRTYWHLCRHLDWRLARRWPRAGWVTLFAPGVLFIALPMLFSLGLWGLAGRGWLAFPVALGLGWVLAMELQKRLHSLWLLRFVIFSTIVSRQEAPGLEDRLDRFAERIVAALDEDWDEVLLIAHSAGTILSMMVMARLLARRGGAMPDHFAVVTLGSVVQLIACRGDAAWFGADLDAVAAGDFRWLDIASVTDGACVPLVAPCLGRAKEAPERLVQITPRWFAYCDPAHYARRRRDKYQTHFDYLRRLDRASPVDYLGLVASARPIAQSIAAFEAQRHA